MGHFAIRIVALWEIRLVSGVLVIRGQVVVVVYWLVYLLVWLVLLVFIVVFYSENWLVFLKCLVA